MKESNKGKEIGVITKDLKFSGSFIDSWKSQWDKSGLKHVDMTSALTNIMAPKEDGEIAIIKKASQATSEVFSKYLKEQIMDIIDGDKVRMLICKSTLNKCLLTFQSYMNFELSFN